MLDNAWHYFMRWQLIILLRREGLAENWQLMHGRSSATGVVRCNKVSQAGRSVRRGHRTSGPLPRSAAMFPARRHKVSALNRMHLNHCCFVWACECASTIKLHTLFEMAYKKRLWVQRVLATREWIGRFHFGICPSKSEVVASQAVLHRKKVVMEVHSGGKKIENVCLSLSLYSFQFLKESNFSLKTSPWALGTRVFVHTLYSGTLK